MSDDLPREWQCPPWDAKEARKIGWLNEQCQEGENFNKNQRGYSDWDKGLQIIAGNVTEREILDYRSNVTGNRLKTNVRVAVAGLSAVRPWGGFQGGKEYAQYALLMNQTTRALYLEGFWDQCIKSGLQWASLTNTGWYRPVYRRNMAGQGHGRVEIDTFGTPSVLPVQLPGDGDYQRAYSVTLLDEKPIWEAHGMFPDFQDRLKPTSSRYWYASGIRKASKQNNGRSWWNVFAPRGQSSGATENLIPLRYTTINDLSVNTTGKDIPMGEYGTTWAYNVPSFKSLIPVPGGTPRPATVNEARLYPRRRLIISSETVVLYDGPAFNWHGELDLIPVCLDKWPWEPIGFSMIHDGWTLQSAINTIDRGTMDKIVADLDRPMGYDMNAVSSREANTVDLMQPRQRIAFDGSQVDKPFSAIAPDDVYRIQPETMVFRKELQADMDYTMQSRDIVELSKARDLGKGMDQLEALISATGPLVKDMSRGMEKSVCGIANQVKYLILQYMDTARLIPYTTEAGAESVFDYNPSSLVPSHLAGEPTVDPDTHQAIKSPTSTVDRARKFADNLVFTLTPHSIHEIHQMSYRLMLMQLKQRGYDIAECDILEANDVPEVRRATGSTTQERAYSEKVTKLEEMVKLQKIVESMGLDAAQILGGSGGKKPQGRPPSGNAPPQLKQKSDGRPTITESK